MSLDWDPPWLYAVLIALGVTLAGELVVVAGGPPTALAHLMYAPIILAAFRFGAPAALLTGVIGGAVDGPLAGWMAYGLPALGTQHLTGYVVRDVCFSAVGLVLGAAFFYARRQAYWLELHLHTDPATTLPNIRAARRHIEAVRKANRNTGEILVKALRVQNYADLARTLGHEHADEVMRVLGQRLRDGLPAGSFVSRTSHDVFTIIDSISEGEDLGKYVSRVPGVDSGTVQTRDLSVYVDTAMGIVRCPTAEADPQAMVAQAEIAATDAGIDDSPYCLYDPDEDKRKRDGVRLLGDVERALKQGEFHLYYQPKLDLRSRTFSGLEALARWRHPTRGMVSPAEFIPLVEQARVIDTFTRWVLREAISQISVWKDRGHRPAVAVNISTRNLASDRLLRYIDELLRHHRVAATSLELEITESALMNVRTSRIDLLRELQAQGVKIALDDFGTGYASLANLRDLPIDILKLDQSFIRGRSQAAVDLRMVKRIVQMAKDLGLEVVAEGVEDGATLRRLYDLDCDQAQGFFIARPLPKDRIEGLLESGWQSTTPQLLA